LLEGIVLAKVSGDFIGVSLVFVTDSLTPGFIVVASCFLCFAEGLDCVNGCSDALYDRLEGCLGHLAEQFGESIKLVFGKLDRSRLSLVFSSPGQRLTQVSVVSKHLKHDVGHEVLSGYPGGSSLSCRLGINLWLFLSSLIKVLGGESGIQVLTEILGNRLEHLKQVYSVLFSLGDVRGAQQSHYFLLLLFST
jgi:hypothetical protein